MKKNIYIDFKTQGIFSLFLIFFTFAYGAIMLLLQIPVNSFAFYASFITSAVLTFVITRNITKTCFVSFLNLFLIFLLFLYFKDTYTCNPDDYTYSLSAIKLLKEGWHAFSFKDAFPNVFKWVVYFPKASWIINAILIKMFNNFEASKLLNTYVMISCFCFCYLAYKSFNLKVRDSLLLALVTVAAPPIFVQMHTYKTDAPLFCMLFILISSMILYIKEERKIWLFTIFASFSLIINLKLNGFFLGGMYGFFVILFLLYKKDFQKAKVLAVTGLSSALISIIILGFNPFMTSLKAHNDPFYPLFHGDSVMNSYTILDFEGQNRYLKFIKSIYSTYNDYDKDGKFIYKAKFPLTLYPTEIRKSRLTMVALSGWGYFFSAVFTASIIALFALRRTKQYKLLLLGTFAILLSVLINPHAWWARFSIHLFFMPLLIIVYSFLHNKKFIAYALLSLMTLNVLANDTLNVINVIKHQKKLNEVINIYKYYGEVIISTVPILLPGQKIILDNNNIKYKYVEMDKFECSPLLRKDLVMLKVCVYPSKEFVKQKAEKGY